MENKLQELTNKIYAEGIQKAEEERKEIIDKAKSEAGDILQKAKEEAEKIIEKANEHSDEIKKNINAELKLSANQAISSIKQKITDIITLKLVDEPTKDSYKDKDFIKNLIVTLVKNWSSAGADAGFSLLLPESEKKDLDKYLVSNQHVLLKKGLDVAYDPNIGSGFKIGPADGSYRISFSDEDFSNFLKAYIRPRTNQLLYGGE